MKISTIGTGFIVDRFIEAAEQVEGVKVYGVHSRTKTRARLFAEGHGIDNYFTDVAEMLTDDQYDTVYIASPNNLHYKYARQALEHGKHVICEKPFTSNLRELQDLIALSREKGLFLFEAVTGIHLPHYKVVKENLHRVGDLKVVQANYSQYSSRYDALKSGEVPNVFNLEFSGGALADLNIYNLHFVIGLLGKPEDVFYLPNKFENGIDTSGVCVMKYVGSIATCIGSKDTKSENSILLQGDKGYIKVNGSANIIDSVEIQTDDYDETIDLGQHENNMVSELEDFKEIYDNGDHQSASGWLNHSINVMETFEEARKSASIMYPADNGR
ncbi:Gfo/Idh/MocA family oxidoreductase [Salinicoccus sp. ID82-1]|uniref:Gfo/Idh/MocA family oxidoreductase n=1 Tax=Salinicoccus cyprini TaxID=2493691 RepID=A0A558ASS6_9STAP|nr:MULTISPECIES: Gfo/Idh/MocA family oxidoreductase [Salinicoccus]MCG1009822.1 Gfo/Idh/MocA family oxidoreductase [Salinicoccus sp. ID82-1]TVT27311.1 Gfo/Idh/MocA family oxidoreductase [Salinicoccus cyprini]